ncbi:MAG: hypothetical protein MI755_16375 [Sphingomonadales bacterium]|nr:hypothetical protein [Sphingomonadales bacterium]
MLKFRNPADVWRFEPRRLRKIFLSRRLWTVIAYGQVFGILGTLAAVAANY